MVENNTRFMNAINYDEKLKQRIRRAAKFSILINGGQIKIDYFYLHSGYNSNKLSNEI